MGYSRYDPPVQSRTAWNAGKTVGTTRPLIQKHIWAIRFFLDRERRLRDRALFDLAIDSKLRGCDLARLSIGDVVAGADIRTRAISPTFEQACWRGWSGEADPPLTMFSQAASTMQPI